MERYVSYCKSCHTLTSEAHKTPAEAGICPKCGAALTPTGITPKEWNRKSQDELKQIRDLLDMAQGTNAEIIGQVKDLQAAYHFTQVQNVPVTTEDLHEDYEIIGPVCVQVTNKGSLGGSYQTLVKKHLPSLRQLQELGQIPGTSSWGFLTGEWSIDAADFSKAFFVCTQELKEKAVLLNADAVIGMRQNMTVDTGSFSWFYLNMYGTAVRRKVKTAVSPE